MVLVYSTSEGEGVIRLIIHQSEKGSFNSSNAGPTYCSPSTDIYGCPWANYEDSTNFIPPSLVPELMKKGEKVPFPWHCEGCYNCKSSEEINELLDLVGLPKLVVDTQE